MKASCIFDLVKVVHVELPDKGRVVFGLEILGENLDELLSVRDDERLA